MTDSISKTLEKEFGKDEALTDIWNVTMNDVLLLIFVGAGEGQIVFLKQRIYGAEQPLNPVDCNTFQATLSIKPADLCTAPFQWENVWEYKLILALTLFTFQQFACLDLCLGSDDTSQLFPLRFCANTLWFCSS